MLHFKNTRKAYNGRTVVDIPSLTLAKGVYWLKGVNGSGKTTLLKMVAGIVPFEGDIILNDISATRKRIAYRQMISWSDAEPLYPDFLTGNDLISFYCGILKSDPKESDELAAALEIKSFLATRVGYYSSGMVKKLSILLAFIGKPRLVLLDEPLTTLDAKAVETVCTLINASSARGTAFLISSHQDVSQHSLEITSDISISEGKIRMGS